ncbi:hypothetical protein [Marinobacter salsuginis]|uniref:hypothetical protein n=1 Tax=Marinobacter salsuginis TaxID=418719 RepID=UPI0012991F79|nr:hypothetical protein [Marinobacter salsuginis]
MTGMWMVLGVLVTFRLMPDFMKHRLYVGLNRFQKSGIALLFMVTLSWIALGIAKPVISIAFCVAAFFVARGSSPTTRIPQTVIMLGANIAALILATMVASKAEIIQGLATGIWGLILFLVATIITNLVNESERSRRLRAAVLLFVAASLLQVLPSPESIKSLFVIGGIFLVSLHISWTSDHYVERPPFLELRDPDGKQPMFGTLRRRK